MTRNIGWRNITRYFRPNISSRSVGLSHQPNRNMGSKVAAWLRPQVGATSALNEARSTMEMGETVSVKKSWEWDRKKCTINNWQKVKRILKMNRLGPYYSRHGTGKVYC